MQFKLNLKAPVVEISAATAPGRRLGRGTAASARIKRGLRLQGTPIGAQPISLDTGPMLALRPGRALSARDAAVPGSLRRAARVPLSPPPAFGHTRGAAMGARESALAVTCAATLETSGARTPRPSSTDAPRRAIEPSGKKATCPYASARVILDTDPVLMNFPAIPRCFPFSPGRHRRRLHRPLGRCDGGPRARRSVGIAHRRRAFHARSLVRCGLA